ncbi:MAG: methyl-accepting chemotaxis protein [Cellulosilyticaceae bacterium]
MKKSKGIGTKLGALIVFITLFIIGISSFTWSQFGLSSIKNQQNLNEILTYTQIVDDVRQTQVNFKIQVQEWKNTLLRGNDQKDFEKYYQSFCEQQENVQGQLAELEEGMIQLKCDVTLVEELIQTHQQLYQAYQQAIKSYNPADVNSYRVVDTLVRGIDRKATEDMDQLVLQIQDFTEDRMNQMLKQERQDIKWVNIKLAIIAIGSLGLISVFAFVIRGTYKNITRFIAELDWVMKHAADGDLTVRGKVVSQDELSVITMRFNEVLDNIQRLLGESQEISHVVSSSSYKINQGITAMNETSQIISHTMVEIAKGATDQSTQVRESHESMVKVVDGIDRVIKHMRQSEDQVDNTEQVVDQGMHTLQMQRTKMDETKGATERVEETITALKLRSKEIGDVVVFINGITDQINLLSLNASIEAARAGEAGKGFTVVADEIKKLADLSKQHTGTISKLITDVQSYIQNVGEDVKGTQEAVSEQELSLEAIENIFEVIRKSIEKVACQAKEVTQETDHMHKAVAMMQKAMSGITEVIENTAHEAEENTATMEEQTAAIEEIAAAMNYLSEQTDVLESLIKKFKLK